MGNFAGITAHTLACHSASLEFRTRYVIYIPPSSRHGLYAPGSSMLRRRVSRHAPVTHQDQGTWAGPLRGTQPGPWLMRAPENRRYPAASNCRGTSCADVRMDKSMATNLPVRSKPFVAHGRGVSTRTAVSRGCSVEGWDSVQSDLMVANQPHGGLAVPAPKTRHLLIRRPSSRQRPPGHARCSSRRAPICAPPPCSPPPATSSPFCADSSA